MSQNGSQTGREDRGNEKDAAAQSSSSSAAAQQTTEQVTEDLGGVQGTAPASDESESASGALGPGAPSSEPVPDAGEIEWAGQVVKKPPTPERD
ncbi:hypothetical protein [Novosphingobium sp. M1R2S20]|uniref:Uncharacterized protein n=1 Tax=Novosphingobium rhizovicinum TaxID=3228928 RepID=A0ABV3RDM5_9SPHN